MTERPEAHSDHVAILGVALAATVSIAAAEGPWEPLETIVGIVLVLVVVAFHDRPGGQGRGEGWARQAVLASVLALCCCLIVAWPLQSIGLDVYWFLPGTWLLAAVAGWVYLLRYDHRRQDGRQAAVSPTVGDADPPPVPTQQEAAAIDHDGVVAVEARRAMSGQASADDRSRKDPKG
ncbi:hypothetical protein [Micromonospora sp. NPDC049374]|uniref:hypothetical protein n=1 Tax=Micromonospora sp. NPDC049374 TaxID=3154352 RepID=UPI00342C1C04